MKPFPNSVLRASILLALVVPLSLPGQFDLGRIKRGLDKVKETSQQVTDTATEAAKIAKGVAGIGPEEERLIGESVALEIIGRHGGVLRDETILRRVNLIGNALAYYSSRPALNWRFAVLDTPAINGFSAPGGLVFITRGLYELTQASDDSLAAVLAHEIAHITDRHALKIIARSEFISGASTLAVRHSSTAAQVQSELAHFDTGIATLAKTILEQGFDSNTELAADTLGRRLAVTVGYAPGALRQVLVQLQQQKAATAPVFSTHPPLALRIKNLPADPAPRSNL